MSRHAFDHEEGRRGAPSTRSVAGAAIVVAIAAVLAWIGLRSGVQAAAPADSAKPESVLGRFDFRAQRTTLVEAARNGEAQTVERLLHAGADLEATDELGQTALTWAVRNGDCSLVHLLLAAGAKTGDADRACGSDLHLACQRDDPLLVGLLLGATESVDLRAGELEQASPLHLACEAGNLRSAEALLAASADIEARDERGFTPLLRACLLERDAAVELLVGRGANVNARDAHGRSALQHATAVGDAASVRILLRAGAEPAATDDRQWTALHYAAAHGRADLIPLLARTQDSTLLDARTMRGMSALHLAARRGESDTVRRLLGAGSEVRALDADGRTARDLVANGRSGEPWASLGEPTPSEVLRRPLPALLDSKPRRPLLCLCTHPARTLRGPLVVLDLALWEDGAMVFAPWSADGKREYVAGAVSSATVNSLVNDLLETGWFDELSPAVDFADRDCIQLTLAQSSRVQRSFWDELEPNAPAGDLKNRASHAERMLAWARVRDVLGHLQAETTQELQYVLVHGSYRGLSFKDGAHADWMH